jgi:CubicO group peptidase (beta-lactamase class C family)
MDNYHDVGLFQGSVLVSHNNEIVFEKGYGEANKEWHIQNTVDTKFRLGSATKPFTAVLIMKLVEGGILDLKGKVSDYLPYYRTDTGTQVSIHHLLTHSSGISMPEMTMEDYWDFFQKKWSTRQLVDSLCQGNLKFLPGTKFSYSSAGYIVLGAILEEVTGKPYARVLSEYILDPYLLKGTGVDNPQDIIPKRSSGYQTNYGFGNARFKYMPSSHASGSLYSTVQDLYLWDQLLRSDDFLSNKTKSLMYSPQIESHRGAFGYGWFIDAVKVSNSIQTRVFHAGDVSGFCALYVRVLESGDFVALLSNQEGLNYYDIAFSLLDLLNGITPEDPKEYLSDLLRDVYFSEGLEALKTRYSSLEPEDWEDFTIDENEINELGYDILTVGDAAGAIQVFKINVELHPNSANAYDSLGEGFLAIGDIEMALANYKKSLRLDPENKNAKKMIESIRENQKH